MTKRKYDDRSSLGRSRVAPFIAGKSASLRHLRRLKLNLQRRDSVERWAEGRGIDLRISNGDHHWKFSKDGQVAEWWPSSAKLVLDQRYDRGIHCHDWKQLIDALSKRWAALRT